MQNDFCNTIGQKRAFAEERKASYSITSPAVASSVGEMAICSRIYLFVTMDIHECCGNNATRMLAET